MASQHRRLFCGDPSCPGLSQWVLTYGAGAEQAESQGWKKLWTGWKTGGEVGGELRVSVQSDLSFFGIPSSKVYVEKTTFTPLK